MTGLCDHPNGSRRYLIPPISTPLTTNRSPAHGEAQYSRMRSGNSALPYTSFCSAPQPHSPQLTDHGRAGQHRGSSGGTVSNIALHVFYFRKMFDLATRHICFNPQAVTHIESSIKPMVCCEVRVGPSAFEGGGGGVCRPSAG